MNCTVVCVVILCMMNRRRVRSLLDRCLEVCCECELYIPRWLRELLLDRLQEVLCDYSDRDYDLVMEALSDGFCED